MFPFLPWSCLTSWLFYLDGEVGPDSIRGTLKKEELFLRDRRLGTEMLELKRTVVFWFPLSSFQSGRTSAPVTRFLEVFSSFRSFAI